MSVMKGLVNFIGDIRNSPNKDAERVRVEKELAHIRQKFEGKKLSGYDRRKYMWKLLYMYMLGYNTVSVAAVMATKLISSKKFAEKNTGYVACATLLNENNDFLKLVIENIRKDLEGPGTNDVWQSLALAAVANVGGQEFADNLAPSVANILLDGKTTSPFPRKKAALCLLRLVRKSPDCIPTEGFAPRCIALLADHDIGVNLCVASLLLGMVSVDPTDFQSAPAACIKKLAILIKPNSRSRHNYYSTVCPWLQVKLLKLLQYFPVPTDPKLAKELDKVLYKILTNTADVGRASTRADGKVVHASISKNKRNADHSILFEAMNLIIHMCMQGVKTHMGLIITKIAQFATSKNSQGVKNDKRANFTYLGLDCMRRLARVPGALVGLKVHQADVQKMLSSGDISIRKRAVELLYVLCDETNCQAIVQAMLTHLEKAPFDLRSELVLKIAVLAERFATDMKWYLDTVLKLIKMSGENVTDDIWHRAAQIIKNNEDVQLYAATTCYNFLVSGKVHENGVKVAAYVLGEFGCDLCADDFSLDTLLDTLQTKFETANRDTKAIILLAMMKIRQSEPDNIPLSERVYKLYQDHSSNIDVELQQRACEFLAMRNLDAKILDNLLYPLPPFPEKESALITRMKGKNKTTDRDAHDDSQNVKIREQKEEESESSSSDSDSDDDDKSGSGSDSDSDADKPAPPTTSAMPDFMGMGDTSSAPSNANAQFPPQTELTAAVWGVDTTPVPIYSDSKVVRIRAALKYSPQALQMAVFVQVAGNSALENLAITCGNAQDYAVLVSPNTPITVSAQSPQKVLLQWKCRKPSDGAPSLLLNFTHNQAPVQLSLTVPVLISHFCTPAAVTRDQYIAQWKQLEQSCFLVDLNQPLTLEQITGRIESAMKLKVLAGIDNDPNNLNVCGTFNSIGLQGNQPMKMVCILRIETKGNVWRVTVRTRSGVLSNALMHSVKTLFRAKSMRPL